MALERFLTKGRQNEQSFVTKTTDFIVRLRERMFFLKKVVPREGCNRPLLVFVSKRIFLQKTKKRVSEMSKIDHLQ